MADDKKSLDFSDRVQEDRNGAETPNEISQLSTFLTESSENPLFIKELEYTREEEAAVIRILDRRLFPWVLLTTFVLNMDRTNNSNAISDNLPADLGFTIDTVNLATALYSVVFSIFTLTGAVIAKLAGPQRCKLQVNNDVTSSLMNDFRDSYIDVLVGPSDRCPCPYTRQRWISYWYANSSFRLY